MAKLKILIVHSSYQYRGGEDAVVEAEIALLRSNGHEVATYFRTNDDIINMSHVSVASQTLWSTATTSESLEEIYRFQPDVIHVHNTLPLISPSIYWAAARAKIPVIQTLHNFRFMCLSGMYLRKGKLCEDCAGNLPWRGVVHKCYRESRSASAVLAMMLTLHRGLGTYRNKISRYIALNDFCRNKFIEGGLPADSIVVKPNFVDVSAPQNLPRKGLLFVGRLSIEKGIALLADAAGLLPEPMLRVVGDGPQANLLNGINGIEALGALSGDDVIGEMNRAIALVMPSIWYENFPRTIVEAFASGLPVICSRIGAMAELIIEGETGLLFETGNSSDLANKMEWALEHPKKMAEMGYNARAKYEAEYTAEQNYVKLKLIYEDAIEKRFK